ncbi:MAG: helix-turn-helix transcriptional regulator [Pirellulales bacterium]|nr:helix-turn-helix transcriptional regulator [Pirellulales bacterium]MBX3435716.1 helix-turn-helix transcriptional regulator [Pirellulales bacterium]
MSTKKKSPPKLLDLAALEQAAECLRTLAHPHRLRMVQLLLQGEYTVGELAEACGIASHMASEHLRLMKHCGLLGSERDGRKTYYTIAEPHLAAILGCIESRFGAA